ncbi:MAG: hypothetical protein EOM59_02965 [Clostridia bacterium]|nr:hypothetical protein [Clostridia bacterium]
MRQQEPIGMGKAVDQTRKLWNGIVQAKYLGVWVGVVLLLATTIAWQLGDLEREELLAAETATETKIVANEVQQSLNSVSLVLKGLAAQEALGMQPKEWTQQAAFIVDNFTAVNCIMLVDQNLRVQEIEPINNDYYVAGDFYGGKKESFYMTNFIEPIYEDASLSGFCIAYIDLPKLVLHTSRNIQDDFVVSVLCENELVASSGVIDLANVRYETSATVVDEGMQLFEVQLIPSTSKVNAVARGSRYWLLYGVIFTIIVSALLFFIQEIHKKNEAMKGHLRDRQRLESIGVLASSVAHEVNTPLNGIMNYGNIIVDLNSSGSKTVEFAKEIIYETQRVSSIVNNLLQYSRQAKQDYADSNPVDIVYRTTSLMNTMLKKDGIAIRVDIPESLPDILCNSQQIQQVLMNLLTNSGIR